MSASGSLTTTWEETATSRETLRDDLSWCLKLARPPVVRPITQWSEDEIILPSGPFRGERFRHRRHPVSRPWFEAIDSNQWTRFAASGPTQNGKTLLCYVLPVLYHLFEIRETVIVGLPSMIMARDKWELDFLPVIQASRYRELIPTAGEGSRGGQVKRAVTFRNGAVLRFMTAGGSDKQRAGYTSRVLAVTETDGMDEPGESSRESDKITQLEGRTRAYGRTGKRVYLECTVSIEQGRIWQEVTQGTDSRLYRPCWSCGEYVLPEREHLIGWQEAESEHEAAEKARWTCPGCQATWSHQQQQDSATQAVLAHRGQKVLPGGRVVGPAPQTQTFGFRWSAIDNPFTSAADLGAEEWRSARKHDRDNAEKEMRQFVWCLPWIPPVVELTPLKAEELERRSSSLPRRTVPKDCIGIAVGIDTGKHRLHWQALAVRPGGSGCVVEYGEKETQADSLGATRGLLDAFRFLRSEFDAGWPDETGKRWKPSQVWIDSGYAAHKDAVYAICQEANAGLPLGQEIYRPTKGFGERQRGTMRYWAPQQKSGAVRYIGKEFHFQFQKQQKILLVHVNSDYWKSDLHQRLAMDAAEQGAVTLYDASTRDEHVEWSRQITAEIQKEEWIPGRGTVVIWDRIRRENHFLDAAYLSLAAGGFVGSEYERQQSKPQGGWFAAQQKSRRKPA